MSEMIQFFSAFGWQGMVFVLIIIIGIFAAKKSGIIATGNQARAANLILSAILFGLAEHPNSETALQSALASVLSALTYELFKYLQSRPSG